MSAQGKTGAFAAWCSKMEIGELGHVRPIHVTAYIEGLQETIAAPSVKLHLAAIRMLFDWLVVREVAQTFEYFVLGLLFLLSIQLR